MADAESPKEVIVNRDITPPNVNKAMDDRAKLKAELRAELEAEQLAAAVIAQVASEAEAQGRIHLIHFIEDGFTALETMWFRGQELEVTEGSPEWMQTLEPTEECRASLVADQARVKHAETCECKSWMNMTDEQQYKRYKAVKFRQGPWPGEQWEDEIKAKEASRRRKVPTPIASLR